MDHTMHTRLMASDLHESMLMDAVVYGPDDEKIGSVSHVHGTDAAAQIVVDVGGFLGIGAMPVLLSASDVSFMQDEDGNVHGTTFWTKDQIRALPEHHH